MTVDYCFSGLLKGYKLVFRLNKGYGACTLYILYMYIQYVQCIHTRYIYINNIYIYIHTHIIRKHESSIQRIHRLVQNVVGGLQKPMSGFLTVDTCKMM